MEKINIAELLRDCPKGMELDCTINEDVKFIKICSSSKYPIILRTKNGYEITLTKYGQVHNVDDSKCVIFPKGKTTWEGFYRPFKDGDIITDGHFDSICIFKGEGGLKGTVNFYCGINDDDEFCIKNVSDQDEHFGEINDYNFATEEQKEKLFNAIEANGYRWNPETKTLEKLVESREDTNDRVVMSGIYFDREYYADEVELHLNNYEIEIRNGKTYAIFKTKTLKPEFKNGDVIVASGAIVLFKQVHCLYKEPHVDFYCGVTSKHRSFILKTGEGQHCGKISSSRYATEKEKAELFNAIKANGYKWNAETKELEKLPKFKVGNRIVKRNSISNSWIVTSVSSEYYGLKLPNGSESIGVLPVSDQDNWELVLDIKPKFKVGDKIKDTRNNSEGIILKVTDKGFECCFEFGNFLVTFSEQDYFNLVQNKSDITLKQSYMEEINLDWCKQHGMTLSQVNVARDTSYYLETNGYIILVYTTSTTGDQKLHVINPDTKKEIEFSLSRLNRDLNKLNSITTDDLRKLCELVNLDYPFKS